MYEMGSQHLATRLLDHLPFTEMAAQLQQSKRLVERIQQLRALPSVASYLQNEARLNFLLSQCREEELAAALQVIAIGQGPVVLRLPGGPPEPPFKLQRLLAQLTAVDKAYDSLGGIVGYHATFLRLLSSSSTKEQMQFFHPPGEDLTRPTSRVHALVRAGLDQLPKMAEVYPVGGAGDRLALRDERTDEPLPAAMLEFQGKTLLEGLIGDLEARELLYNKLHGDPVITPVVLMTSAEKNNSDHVQWICEDRNWFGRPRESFFLITQCSVPVITEHGEWVMQAPLELLTKPGGHGALWKLMEDSGAFDWLAARGRSKGLLRQINNPVAGIDYGLLAFCGAGFVGEKAFGFSACQRAVGAAEGMDVLFERQADGGYLYGISSIEYTDFAKYGIHDVPERPGSSYSQFPSNTNILFFDLQTIREIIRRSPIPGLLINLKQKVAFLDANGQRQQARAGRLESSVQNIADHLALFHRERADNPEVLTLPTYATFGERHRTISVTKKQYTAGSSLLETPEGCYYDILLNARELLVGHCGFDCPKLPSRDDFMREGPPFHCRIAPSLGPLYSVMGQKLRGGRLEPASELQLALAELDVEALVVKGSLLIRAGAEGAVRLSHVTIENRGIDWRVSNRFWQERIQRQEALEIVVEEGGEFIAENVTIQGGQKIVVSSGIRAILSATGLRREKLSGTPWSWQYHYGPDQQPILQRGSTPARTQLASDATMPVTR
jgi:UTP---glucose-1-phosphate uridylyltransferase